MPLVCTKRNKASSSIRGKLIPDILCFILLLSICEYIFRQSQLHLLGISIACWSLGKRIFQWKFIDINLHIHFQEADRPSPLTTAWAHLYFCFEFMISLVVKELNKNNEGIKRLDKISDQNKVNPKYSYLRAGFQDLGNKNEIYKYMKSHSFSGKP